MKISDTTRALSGLESAQSINPSTGGQLRDGALQPDNSDQVSLSSLSAQLGSGQSDVPVHAARLGSLAADVASGQYRVDPELVSASIIQHSLQMGGAGLF